MNGTGEQHFVYQQYWALQNLRLLYQRFLSWLQTDLSCCLFDEQGHGPLFLDGCTQQCSLYAFLCVIPTAVPTLLEDFYFTDSKPWWGTKTWSLSSKWNRVKFSVSGGIHSGGWGINWRAENPVSVLLLEQVWHHQSPQRCARSAKTKKTLSRPTI